MPFISGSIGYDPYLLDPNGYLWSLEGIVNPAVAQAVRAGPLYDAYFSSNDCSGPAYLVDAIGGRIAFFVNPPVSAAFALPDNWVPSNTVLLDRHYSGGCNDPGTTLNSIAAVSDLIPLSLPTIPGTPPYHPEYEP